MKRRMDPTIKAMWICAAALVALAGMLQLRKSRGAEYIAPSGVARIRVRMTGGGGGGGCS